MVLYFLGPLSIDLPRNLLAGGGEAGERDDMSINGRPLEVSS